jgi:hypothetical protein
LFSVSLLVPRRSRPKGSVEDYLSLLLGTASSSVDASSDLSHRQIGEGIDYIDVETGYACARDVPWI